jgi:hypothetical protein
VRATAYADFTSRYSVQVRNVRLKDICPGDGNSVFVEFQYKQSARGDWVTRGEKRRNSSGCGTTTDETTFSFTATSGRIAAVRLRACVDETFPNNDDCGYSNTRENPYDWIPPGPAGRSRPAPGGWWRRRRDGPGLPVTVAARWGAGAVKPSRWWPAGR